MSALKESEVAQAFEHIFHSRIVCLLAYGSIANGRSTAASDLDLLLLLDTYSAQDLLLCRQAIGPLRGYSLDLSLQYLDEMPDQPQNFRDGTKGCLALAYLSSARVLVGTNIPKQIFDQLSPYELRRSIISTLEEYVQRMYTQAIASEDIDGAFKTATFKYLTRSIVDAMLYYQPSDMAPYMRWTRPEILERSRSDPRLNAITGSLTVDSPALDMVQAMHAITIQLKGDFSVVAGALRRSA